MSRTLVWSCLVAVLLALPRAASAQGTRLLRQPTLSEHHVAFAYGADLWVADRTGGLARRLTSTPAVESGPHFSPDGRFIAFTSNRSGTPAVYVVPVEGGDPTRLTWHPSPSYARGWTPDGSRVFYASSRGTAPGSYNRLWTVPRAGGPSTLLPAPMGNDGSFAPDGRRIVVDRVRRWDPEFRSYRGGQNTPLTILSLGDLAETRIASERTTDLDPVWLGNRIFFVSDRDWAANVWSYDVASGAVQQLTRFTGAEVKNLSGNAGSLVFEQDGWIHTLDPATGRAQRLSITVQGDFPWAAPRWEDVTSRAGAAALSPKGRRVVFEARGEIFTVPVEHGDTRNLTRSSGAADRAPVWSPDGERLAWFSDSGQGYALLIAGQDGLGAPRRIAIGESKMAWEPAWSPDGSSIAFVDDHVRVRVVEVESGRIRTVDTGGVNIERGGMGLTWSHDSRFLAYAKTFRNNFRRIVVWSRDSSATYALTDALADASSPAWDRNGRHLYFVASTNLALGSGWANTSASTADPTQGVYLMVLRADDPTPFPPRSDEEGDTTVARRDTTAARRDSGAARAGAPDARPDSSAPRSGASARADTGAVRVRIDREGIARRIVPLPTLPVRRYAALVAGPKGTVFVGERVENQTGLVLHKFVQSERKATEFVRGVSGVSVSRDGEKILFRAGTQWRVVGTARTPEGSAGNVRVALRMHLDRADEWRQIFDETWHYERDFFYDPGMHGNDWNAVRERYRPLVEWVRHRADLTYLIDQVNAELSVGHSYVRDGDLPAVDTSRVGLLGADLVADGGRWRIARIYTFESWNPDLVAPLDRPGLSVRAGQYLVGVEGMELTAADDPYRLLDGTAGRQTVLMINDLPTMDGHWTVTVEPTRSEDQLRQRAWVEDNRRRVDSLSNGRLAYVWVPNTGGAGVISFNRYFFAQQDREGAVIDERFNGGGSLDDYMVDYMTRSLRAAITNEAPGGAPFRLPAGVLGPKVLLINEMAGSGGDYFPFAFRQQQAGPLIGTRTWGGLVAAAVHYAQIDGGSATAPANAVFDPINNRWIAENEGVPPDIEVLLDARSVAAGRDPQLERGVQEALRLLQAQGTRRVVPPPFPQPSRRPR